MIGLWPHHTSKVLLWNWLPLLTYWTLLLLIFLAPLPHHSGPKYMIKKWTKPLSWVPISSKKELNMDPSNPKILQSFTLCQFFKDFQSKTFRDFLCFKIALNPSIFELEDLFLARNWLVMISLRYASNNAYSACKTRGVLRGGALGVNRCYVLAHCAPSHHTHTLGSGTLACDTSTQIS